ncbi:M1 family metallopeptidase [Spirosoma linguale]|uniref:Aminopeptidase N n=1 Tax=Spirosoma linguale (strain ATCC 33905 / DSM 74 / LMG 10896 / Claus 1) TaxID=504472 RepID=D2QSK7_SPILD|nr:Peptidase M1 membrane alanine aminopeptidase [Spirosoma linguale DSM 74]
MKEPKKGFLAGLLLLAAVTITRAQLPIGYAARYAQPGVDVQHYAFTLTLSDSTNQIKGETTIRFTRSDDRQTVWFDLISPRDSSETGMRVRSVSLSDGKAVPFSQRNDRVFINLPAAPNQVTDVVIRYDGTPARGLIISQNKFGERTFFGDNWPNNARNYLPVVDHPSDKATCSFAVNAPATYRVISNGKLQSESNLPGGRKLTRWQENTPIPTKVMVIGAAKFAVEEVGSVSGVPVQSWLYPNDSQKGFVDYRPAKEILQYFINKVGPYSYEKLANVESTTIFGGMENASCIFYNEKIIVGKKDSDVEALLAHEIAHQWFGNSATEADWSQLWLSEGFATYFSALYLEHAYGKDTLNAVMNQNKGQIFRFSALKPKGTIVDSMASNLMDLLNPNSYQKGGWVLHMLRHELGDEVFWKGIRAYYEKYRNANAQSSDLQAVMESVSGKKLGQFFQQWLHQPGYPEVVWGSKYDAAKKALVIDVRQAQRTGVVFAIPLTFSIRGANGREISRTARLSMTEQNQTFTVPLSTKPVSVVIDPDNTVLMRAVEMGK